MRVLQILPELNVGGVERGVMDLSKSLKRRGIEVQVISNGGALVPELVKMGIPHYSLPVHEKSLLVLRTVKEVSKIIMREKIDIIHARSRVPAWVAYLASRRTGCDFVTTCHGYYSKHFFSKPMGWGKRVIAISHSIGRRMIDDFGVPPERIRLIHRGIDLSQYQFSAEKYRSPVPEKYVISLVGRITPIKGHREFIQAFHLLSKQIENVEAWIVGSPDKGKESYATELKILVSRFGLTQKVKFLGTRRDIPDILKKSDLLILPTKIPEAFGRVIAEAGAVGTAALASRIGGILDVIDEEKNGLLFFPHHMEEMTKAMMTLLKDREKCYQFACALRKKVESEFSLDQMVEKTIQVYEETRKEKKILITKLGALGDLVLATPSIRMIRRKFPQANISLLVDSKLTAIADRCPYLNDVITYDRSNRTQRLRRFMRLAKRIRDCHFDLSVDLQNNDKTHLLAFLARIPYRVGYLRGLSGHLLTHQVQESGRPMLPLDHQFEVLKRIGINQLDDVLELWPDPSCESRIHDKWPALFDGSSKLVGFSIGSSPKWVTKRWPVSYFIELAERLISQTRSRIVLIGSTDDLPLARQFMSHLFPKNSVINCIGETDILELLSVIKMFRALVTNDSAPMHIAAAFKVKLIALFGPTEPNRHIPPGSGHTVFVRRIPCQPCYSGTCKNPTQLQCLRDIEVNDVFQSIKRELQAASGSRQASSFVPS